MNINMTLGDYLPQVSCHAQLDQLHLVRARDILWDIGGVRTAFGIRRRIFNIALDVVNGELPTLLPLDKSFIVASGGVLYDDRMRVLHTAQARDTKPLDFDYPWTHAHVGDVDIYAHPNYSLVIRARDGGFSDFCPTWASPVFSVASIANRLLVLLSDTIIWSDIDDPLVYGEPRLTGSGFQSLNLAGFGAPLGTAGNTTTQYVFTTSGVMRIRVDEAAIYAADGKAMFAPMIFNHVRIPTRDLPCSPAVIRASDGAPVWLTPHGLFAMNDGGAQPIDPTYFEPELSATDLSPKELRFAVLPHIYSFAALVKANDTRLLQSALKKHGQFTGHWYDMLSLPDNTIAVLSYAELSIRDMTTRNPASYFTTAFAQAPQYSENARTSRAFRTAYAEINSSAECKYYTDAELVGLDACRVETCARDGKLYGRGESKAFALTVRATNTNFHIHGATISGVIAGRVR